MLKKFLPDEHVQSILDIHPEMLKKRGIKGLITDLDNTLVAWNEAHMTPELASWFDSFREAGISVMILSNNSERRVKLFSEPAHVPYVHRAKKPMAYGFRRALKEMRLKKNEVVVAGDQIVTDIFGGNQFGVHTILVVPVALNDAWLTKINRTVERFILSQMRRRGWLKWEE